jgi:hypothetical protein
MSRSGSRSESVEEVGGEAFEVKRPEGERDEEPIVDVPDEVGVASGGDLFFEGVEFFEERGAVGGAAEGELVEVFEVLLEVAEHRGEI